MTDWPDILVPHVGDADNSGAFQVDTVFGGVKDFRDAVAGAQPWNDWTPRLVVHDANGSTDPGVLGHDWTPSTGSNPTLGTGSHVEGRYIQVGKLVVARATIIFGTSGVNAGSGPYRISLPVPCTAAANAATGRAIVGAGQIYNDSTASSTFGLGPNVYRHIDLHVAESITTDVAGLLNTAGLPLTSLQGGGYTVTNHTDRRTISETTITLPQLANVVGTMLNDIATLLTENQLVDVSESSPWAWAANDRITVALAYEAA